MNKLHRYKFFRISFAFALVSSINCQAQILPTPTQEAKPGVRWWWLGSAVDKENLKWNIDEYAKAGFGFISFSPLAQGLLTDRYLKGIPADSRMAKAHFLKHSALTPELLEKLQELNATAQTRNETLAEMALTWILHQKGVTSVLVGASSTAQLEKNMKCVHAAPFLL